MQGHGEPGSGHGAATIPQSGAPVHRAADLEALFHDTFHSDFATVLEGGFEEPVYLPGKPHRIRYTRDYFRSALHEVAHWCVAGPRRRTLEDYGYWYAPDGRDAAQQARFLTVEVRPQAFEALFCAACGHDFRVSLDNLDGDPGDADRFAKEVYREARRLIRDGLPLRARRWVDALRWHYGGAGQPLADRLNVPTLAIEKE